MTQVGYARVSSAGQSLEVQLAKLAGCQKIFQEQHNGSSDKRHRLLACLEYTFSGGYAKNPVKGLGLPRLTSTKSAASVKNGLDGRGTTPA